ncbi:MAG: hypothetical protein ABSG53_03865 [Thermoguttaceae bacterium]
MAAIPCKVACVFRGVSAMVASGLLLLGTTASLHAQTLESIRNDVRDGPPPGPASSPLANLTPQTPSQPSNNGTDPGSTDPDNSFGWLLLGAAAVGAAVVAPIWVPITLCDDNYSRPAYLHQFPYDDTTNPPETFPFAIRFDADYVDAFDNLDRFNGHLLISTASRFEFDSRFQHLAERLSDEGEDQLWMGDCNVTYRFAQSDFGQFRAGLGVNWLNDSTQTDLGFNFTYGADLFPAKLWVFSAVLDAGTLGHAGLLRFRTTAGVVYRSVELYSGYEYTDIGSVHWNGLIGGVRLWF